MPTQKSMFSLAASTVALSTSLKALSAHWKSSVSAIDRVTAML
jgi:hypothetical protein